MSVGDFSDALRRRNSPTGDWRDGLSKTEEGAPRKNLHNACVALRDHPALEGKLGYDEFAGCTYVRGPLPWDDRPNRPWTPFDDLAATEWLQSASVGILIGSAVVREAVERVAYENRFHPVLAWLESLQWDGVPRLDTWLTTYMGVRQSPLASAISTKFLISAVARVMRPGCKVDHVLILEGPQGILKSKSLRALVGEDWITDQIADLGTKDSCQDLRGVWVIELSELSAIRPGEVERVKAYISRQVDHYRPSYGRRSIDVPRQCVFIGTTNAHEYLSDATGGRRFWPVTCTVIDIDAIARDRSQIWAEAVAAYHSGELWWLDDEKLRRAAEEEQALRRICDPWEEIVAAWLDDPTQLNGDGIHIPLRLEQGRVTNGEILEHAICKPTERQTTSDQMRVGRILTRLGWKKRRVGKARVMSWERDQGDTPGEGDTPPERPKERCVYRGVSTQNPQPEPDSGQVDTPDIPNSHVHAVHPGGKKDSNPGKGVSRCLGVSTPSGRERVGACAHCRFDVFTDNMVRTESGALLHYPCVGPWSRT